MVFSFRLLVIDNTVVLLINDQDDEFTDFIKQCSTSVGGMAVKSVVSPELTENTIFIRGRNKDDDDRMATYSSDSKEEALVYAKQALMCLHNTFKRAMKAKK